MGAGQLQPKRDPDIARSDCPVPHLGQRCRVLPVNVSSDSVRDCPLPAPVSPPIEHHPKRRSSGREAPHPAVDIRRVRARSIRLFTQQHTPVALWCWDNEDRQIHLRPIALSVDPLRGLRC